MLFLLYLPTIIILLILYCCVLGKVFEKINIHNKFETIEKAEIKKREISSIFYNKSNFLYYCICSVPLLGFFALGIMHLLEWDSIIIWEW